MVSGLFEIDELQRFRLEAERLFEQRALLASRGGVLNGSVRADRLDPVIDLSPLFAKLAIDPRLRSLAGEILGGAAQLFKDRLIFKPPGATGYGAHQDAPYWPEHDFAVSDLVTVSLFLDPATSANGAIECVSGCHGHLLTPPGVIADPDERLLGAFTTVEAKAGDLLLLHSHTPHRSGDNRSTSMRRVLSFVYGADVEPDFYGRYQRSRLRRGLSIGQAPVQKATISSGK